MGIQPYDQDIVDVDGNHTSWNSGRSWRSWLHKRTDCTPADRRVASFCVGGLCHRGLMAKLAVCNWQPYDHRSGLSGPWCITLGLPMLR